MKIKYRLLLTHGLLVLLSLVIVLTKVLAFNGISNDAVTINQLGRLRVLSYNMGHIANRIFSLENSSISTELHIDLGTKINEFESLISSLGEEGLNQTKHVQTKDKLKKISDEWNELFNPLYLGILDNKADIESYRKINNNIDSFVKGINEMVTSYSIFSREKVISALKINAGLVIVIIGITVYSFTTINRRIRKPMNVLMNELKELSLADDEISSKLENLHADEITEMTQYFNLMIFDQLTKVFNRRSGLAKLNRLIQSENRRQLKMSLCFIDINGLKEVNDQLGHQFGDELIISAADCIKNAIREEDFIIRMGGDEFLVVFKDIGAAMAEKVWERIKSCYQYINEQENRPYLISVSHGIAEYDSFDKPQIEILITEEDDKMYTEKRHLKEELKIQVIRG